MALGCGGDLSDPPGSSSLPAALAEGTSHRPTDDLGMGSDRSLFAAARGRGGVGQGDTTNRSPKSRNLSCLK